MLSTYKAKLKGDRLEWAEEPPPQNGATPDVLVTILPASTHPPEDRVERGAHMKAALDKLAEMGGIKSIPDPLAWQREIREDRPLPGRED